MHEYTLSHVEMDVKQYFKNMQNILPPKKKNQKKITKKTNVTRIIEIQSDEVTIISSRFIWLFEILFI